MNDNIKSFDSLKDCKNTKHRESVLKVLKNASKPLTAEDIFFQLKEANITVSLSTVYRTLELLVSKDIVSKSYLLDDNKARFEFVQLSDHKHYYICTVCNKMLPIPSCPLENIEKILPLNINFNITGHKLEIYGQCLECKAL